MRRIISILLCFVLLFLALTACQSEIGEARTAANAEASDGADTVKVVRIKKDLAQYGKLTKSHMELVDVSADVVTDNLVTDINDVLGYFAKKDLHEGDYLYSSYISKTQLSSGSRDMLRQDILESKESFVVVSDYIKPNTGEDVYSHIQNLINKNPGRTLYFTDGEYLISASLITKSEGPKSTTFFFSDNAVLKAAPNWREQNGHRALICLGQVLSEDPIKHVNDSTSNGSYFGVFGGILDGSDLAQGISIDSSRESVIYGTCIKNTTTGIVIKHGANGGPSDADVENVEIIGSGLKNSKGIAIYGTDNTITNVKIVDMENGVYSVAPGNAFRSVDVYFSENYKNYQDSVGFHQAESVDFFWDCYVENAAVAYKLSNGHGYILDSLSAAWTYQASTQTAFYFTSEFNSRLTQPRVDFFNGNTRNTFIKAGSGGGKIDTPILNTEYESNGKYKDYLTKNGVIDLSKIN